MEICELTKGTNSHVSAVDKMKGVLPAIRQIIPKFSISACNRLKTNLQFCFLSSQSLAQSSPIDSKDWIKRRDLDVTTDITHF